MAELLREAVKDKLPGAFVVVNRAGNTPGRQAMLAAIKAAQSRAGLPERSHHSLRHYFATGILRHGANLEVVRALLGHSKIATTERYLHAVTDASTVAAIGKLAGR